MTPWVEIAVVGVQLCSTIAGIIVQEHFLIQLNDWGFFCWDLYWYLYLGMSTILVSEYVGVGNSSFLTKMILFFLTGTILVPVEIELVPRFGLLPSPRLAASTRLKQKKQKWISNTEGVEIGLVRISWKVNFVIISDRGPVQIQAKVNIILCWGGN